MTQCEELLAGLSTEFHAACAARVLDDGCRLSLPMETTGGHNVELHVRQVGKTFVLSDMGRTLSELISYGADPFRSTSKSDRLSQLLKEHKLQKADAELRMLVENETLPSAVLRFAFALKTIGDMALLHRVTPVTPYRLNLGIRSILNELGAVYGEGREAKVPGVVEPEHQLDFLGTLIDKVTLSPRKVEFGIAVIGGQNSRQLAEAWAFRFLDMRQKNPRLRRIAVYDDEQLPWRPANLRILRAMTEATVPGSSLGELAPALLAA